MAAPSRSAGCGSTAQPDHGTGTAQASGMAFITMWSRGDRTCMVVFSGEQITLRLVEGDTVIREQVVIAGGAIRLAEIWETEDRCAEWREGAPLPT